MLTVELVPEAMVELRALPAREQAALENAIRKLEASGDRLGYPHSSALKGLREPLRELRPRAGDCAWRAFYRRCGDTMVIAAIEPEAKRDPAAFARAVGQALDRLEAV